METSEEASGSGDPAGAADAGATETPVAAVEEASADDVTAAAVESGGLVDGAAGEAPSTDVVVEVDAQVDVAVESAESPPEAAGAAEEVERYPTTIYQDHVGNAFEEGDSAASDAEPLLATERNVLARRNFLSARVNTDGGSLSDDDEYDDGESSNATSGLGDWDSMFMGSYFSVMGFLFKMNSLRIDQQQLPKAIGLLICVYFVFALYIANVILGALMIYVGHKYSNIQPACEEDLSGWLFVMGVYICASAAVSALSLLMTIVMKKDYLSFVKNIGSIFALVWFIIGCVRTYKIDSSDHKCNDVVYDTCFYYCTVVLSVLPTIICCACCVGIVAAVKGVGQDPNGDDL